MKPVTTGIVLSGLLLTACNPQKGIEDQLVGKQRTAFESCKAEIKEEFNEELYDMNLPNPKLRVSKEAISFIWNLDNTDDGGPIFCSTDQTGKSILEIRLASAPLG